MADFEAGDIVPAGLAGALNGKPLYRAADPCATLEAGAIVPAALAGMLNGKPLYKRIACRLPLEAGDIVPAGLAGALNGKPLYKAFCDTCGPPDCEITVTICLTHPEDCGGGPVNDASVTVTGPDSVAPSETAPAAEGCYVFTFTRPDADKGEIEGDYAWTITRTGYATINGSTTLECGDNHEASYEFEPGAGFLCDPSNCCSGAPLISSEYTLSTPIGPVTLTFDPTYDVHWGCLNVSTTIRRCGGPGGLGCTTDGANCEREFLFGGCVYGNGTSGTWPCVFYLQACRLWAVFPTCSQFAPISSFPGLYPSTAYWDTGTGTYQNWTCTKLVELGLDIFAGGNLLCVQELSLGFPYSLGDDPNICEDGTWETTWPLNTPYLPLHLGDALELSE